MEDAKWSFWWFDAAELKLLSMVQRAKEPRECKWCNREIGQNQRVYICGTDGHVYFSKIFRRLDSWGFMGDNRARNKGC